MEIGYSKYTNEAHNRLEFWLINWDYIDGNDYIAKLFSKEYGFVVGEKFDGIWYGIIRIHLGKCEYELLWHEDTGNAIYSLNQTEKENDLLQKRLERVLDILNARIKECQNSNSEENQIK